MPQPDYQGFGASFQPLQNMAADQQALAASQQMAGQYLAGQQLAKGNVAGGVGSLYASGNIPAAQQEQVFGNTTAGASALAGRNYGRAASSFGQAGDTAGVQTAQQGQMQQYQMLGSYLKNAMPVYQAAYQHNGAAGLAHAVQETGAELAQSGLIRPDAVQGYVQQASTDPEGFLSNIGNFIQQVGYQKVGTNTVLMTDPWGRPVGMATGQTQATLNNPNGSQTQVTTGPQITGVGAPAAPPAQAAAPAAAQPAQAPVNNPGNLKVPGSATDFQQFPTPQAGMEAMQAQLTHDITPVAQGGKGLTTLTGLISNYAPPNENNTAAYIASVSGATGIDPNAPISPAQIPAIQRAMIQVEQGQNAGQYLNQGAGSPSPPGGTVTAPGSAVTATTDNGQPMYRPATPAEAASYGYATGQIDQTGKFTGVAKLGDINNLTPQALQQGAEQYRLTGVMPLFGRSQGAAVAYEQIKNMAAEEDAKAGITPAQRQVMQATYGAAQKSNQQLIPQLSAMQAYERTTMDDFQNVQNMVQAGTANAGIRTGNDLQNFIREEFGSKALGQYKIYLNDANSNYSKLVLGSGTGSGGAPGSASEREENADLFSENDPPGTILAKIQAMKLGMTNRTKEIAAQVQKNNQIMMTGGIDQSVSGPSPTQPSATSPQFSVGQTATGPGGAKIQWNGQSWLPVQASAPPLATPSGQQVASGYLH
ncbi:MAG: hypothetical protein KGL20_05195 [Rhodospirillales bacterium]|nr:hypothetical protein [Rhodospirillales bacterium]